MTAPQSGGFLGRHPDPASGDVAEVTAVRSDSPAADAGLQEGDVITEVDSDDIANAAALASAIFLDGDTDGDLRETAPPTPRGHLGMLAAS
jgi:S1-C subfamily serine protease